MYQQNAATRFKSRKNPKIALLKTFAEQDV